MKKSSLFQKSTVSVPKTKWRNKNHTNVFAQPFARVVPHMWLDVDPGEKFKIRDVDKLFSSPFVGLNLSHMTMKTRYFAVPLRKAVPNFEQFITSSPSDNLTDFHTKVYDLLRGACMLSDPSPIKPAEWSVFRQNLGVDGNANFFGIPWLLDQLCCIIFGKDLQFMREWTGGLLEAGLFLDDNEAFDNFDDWFYNRVFAVAASDTTSSGTEVRDISTRLIFTRVAISGSSPNYFYGNANLAYYTTDTMPYFALNFANFLKNFNGGSWPNLLNYMSEESYSFDDVVFDAIHGVVDDQGTMNNSDLIAMASTGKDPQVTVLSNPSRDSDNTDTLFGQPVRLAPFCAYQKVIYDWFVDLRFNDNLHDEFVKYYEEGNNATGSYLRWSAQFVYTSSVSGQQVAKNTLSFLLGQKVVDYRKDYFTTAALEPQAGPDLVIGPNGRLNLMFDVQTAGVTDNFGVAGVDGVETGDSGQLNLVNGRDGVKLGDLWAQINQADEITPIKLRWQLALQRLLENRNIGGYTRYTDLMLGQYGIRVPDPYLLRSVYLGGFKTVINSELVVAKSDGSNGSETSQLGDLGSYGFGTNSSPTIRGYVREHVMVLGVNYVVPQNYYTQGLPSRLTDIHLLDKPHWQFKNVGEQPVACREIFLGATPSEIFGYQKRYSDKKFMFDEIHGEFLDTLRYMHTGRKFLSQPHLDQNLLSMRGEDGHDDVFSVSPKETPPFWVQKFIFVEHKMII